MGRQVNATVKGELLSTLVLLLLVPIAVPEATHHHSTDLICHRRPSRERHPANPSSAAQPPVLSNVTAHRRPDTLHGHLPLVQVLSSGTLEVPPTQRRRSSPSGDRALRRNKRRSDALPSPGNTRLAKSRKRKKRRQNKKKKERLRNLRRSGRKFRKRRRRMKLGGKSINHSASTASASPSLDRRPFHLTRDPHTHGHPFPASPSTHNAHLVKLLTGGNQNFLKPRSDSSKDSTDEEEAPRRLSEHPHTKKLIFLPLKIVSGGNMEWLPYNPDIRVSIQVTGGHHYDHTDDATATTRPPSSEDSKEDQGTQKKTEVTTKAGNTHSSQVDGMNDKLIITLSKTNGPSEENTFDKKAAVGGKKREKTSHANKPAIHRDGATSGKVKEEVAHDDKLGKRESPKSDSAVSKSTKRSKAEASVSKEPNKLNGEHRGNGRQRARSSTDMVVELADALESILRSGDEKPTGRPAAGADRDACDSWASCRVEKALQGLAKLPTLPSCPCVYPAELPYQPRIYDAAHDTSFKWVSVSRERERIDVYHRGAEHCIRSHVTAASLASQTCCYDGERRLLTRGSGAGSPALVSPQVNLALHWQVDILPWLACKGNFLRYQAVRKPDNGLECPNNPDSIKYQQQVYMATDY
ncbi:uncharacterized protein LOC127005788 isoform X2 [Eriocheir sinensis]|nr:uncharacterized protein LOC127005788 isoform X2 [Eriocheir sinensis]